MRELHDSGIEWIGIAPSSWKVAYLSSVLSERKHKNVGMQEDNLLSLSYGNVKQKDINTNDGLLPESFEGYNIIEVGDIVLRLTDLQNDHRSLRTGLCRERGIITSAYCTLKLNSKEDDPRFLRYYLHCFDLCKGFYGMGAGVRQGLNFDGIRKIEMLLPAPAEQTAISDYLDAQMEKVDALIANQQAQIEKLKQYKQSLITEVVTKGLNPNAPMKDSGVEWIGMMPEHWQLIRFRFIADITTGNSDTQDANPDGAYPFYVRSPIVERSNDYTFEGPGILMAGDGAGAGRVFHLVDGKYAVHQRVYRFYNFRYVDKELLKYYLENLFSTVMDYGSAKTTVPSVRLPMIQNFQVCVPPLAEQEKMVEIIRKHASSIDKLIDIKEKKIEKLTDYKKSRIYEYVTGKKEVS